MKLNVLSTGFLSVFVICVLLLTIGCGGGGGSNPFRPDPDDLKLARDYEEVVTAYTNMGNILESGGTVDDRVASFSEFIHVDYKFDDDDGDRDDLISVTKSRLERYEIIEYSFRAVNEYEEVATDTLDVKTEMKINVNLKPGASGSNHPRITLRNRSIVWKKVGDDWQIYRGLPYKEGHIWD